VQAATDDYFQSENTLGRWVDERCQAVHGEQPSDRCDPNAWTDTRALYRDYAEWSQRVREFILPERVFVQKLEGLGIEPAKHSRTRRGGFRGIQLRFTTPDMLEALDNKPPASARDAGE
jgi:putative DNA primase/helicase